MSTNDSFHLKVVTPVGVALEEEVTSVTLPTADGEIGILPHHIDYNGILGVGVLSYSKVGSPDLGRIVVTGGFTQFGENTLIVLADVVDLPESVDPSKYGTERSELEQIVNTEDTHSSRWQIAKDRLARIEAIDRLMA